MDGAHIHLLLNHFPIVGLLITTALLTVGVLFNNRQLKTASLWLLLVVALITIPVFLSGEEAEDAIEQVGPTHDYVEAHEEAGEIGFYLMIGLGAIALVTLALKWFHFNFYKTLTIITVLFAWVVFADMAYIGNLGGQITHEEIRNDNLSISPGYSEEEVSGEDDDD